jgi:hypothetical protein
VTLPNLPKVTGTARTGLVTAQHGSSPVRRAGSQAESAKTLSRRIKRAAGKGALSFTYDDVNSPRQLDRGRPPIKSAFPWHFRKDDSRSHILQTPRLWLTFRATQHQRPDNFDSKDHSAWLALRKGPKGYHYAAFLHSRLAKSPSWRLIRKRPQLKNLNRFPRLGRIVSSVPQRRFLERNLPTSWTFLSSCVPRSMRCACQSPNTSPTTGRIFVPAEAKMSSALASTSATATTAHTFKVALDSRAECPVASI